MEDTKLLPRLRRGDVSALEHVITRYSAYVAAVIRNQLGELSVEADVEELSSDVFAALWKSRDKLRTEHLRGWLGATARNRARSHLRAMGEATLPLDDELEISGENLAALTEEREQAEYIRRALSELEAGEKEVFLRFYYYDQTVAALSAEMGINPSTAKSRLRRGRMKLREKLIEGGYGCEIEDK